jgi:hypothetical protein
MYICMYVCTNVYMYICMYVYMFMCVRTYEFKVRRSQSTESKVTQNGLKQLTGQLTTRTSLLHRLIVRRVLFYIQLTQTNNPTTALQLPQRLACRIRRPNLPEAPFTFCHCKDTHITTGAG